MHTYVNIKVYSCINWKMSQRKTFLFSDASSSHLSYRQNNKNFYLLGQIARMKNALGFVALLLRSSYLCRYELSQIHHLTFN